MRKTLAVLAGSAALAVTLSACGGSNGLEGLSTTPAKDLTRNHEVGSLKYDLTKSIPMGGDHNAKWVSCGFWGTPVAPEYTLHAMEHGAVWIAYDPMVSDFELSVMRDIASKHPFVVITPVESAPHPITLTAWGVQIHAKDMSDPRIDTFITTYEQGPQTPEPGAPCSEGGIKDAATAMTAGDGSGGMNESEEATPATGTKP